MKLMSNANWKLFVFLIFPILFQQSTCEAEDLSDLAILDNGNDQFTELRPQERVDDYLFYNENRNLLSMRKFRGSNVILNFWATWCAPCIKEMPSLAQLADNYSDQNIQVVAVSLDHTGVDHVRDFLNHISAGDLKIYFDPENRKESVVTRKNGLKIYGLPITYFINKDGYVLGYIVGSVDWQSNKAKYFLENFIKK
jgi:thiol-disulfide isomerase/thioredoxin